MSARAGAQAYPAPAVGATVVSRDVYPAHRVTFPGGVTGVPNVVYASQPGFRPLTLDLYLPPAFFSDDHGPRPFVVYVHGGGWTGGSERTSGAFADWPAALASVAARGYVVASIQYRLSGEAPSPAAIQDVKTAIRWLRAHADSLHVDSTRALVWGAAAGAQLADVVGTSCGVAALEPPAGSTGAPPNYAVERNTAPPSTVSDCVQGVVSWYGVTDFVGRLGAPELAFLGCKDAASCTEQARLASPLTYVDAKSPPFLLIAGTSDRTVPYVQSQQLFEALKAKRVHAELILLHDIDHDFLGATPEATRDASLQAWASTVAFIDRTIGDRVGVVSGKRP